jgi:S1-C subfamily serine protease
MTEQPESPSSKKWVYAFTLTLTVLILNTGIFTVTYLQTKRQLSTFETSLADQKVRLQDLQQQIEILDYINQTCLSPWPKIYDQIKHSVVLIETNLYLGSGVVYNHEGYIITNYHVIEGATTIQVTFLDGSVTLASIVGEDPYSELAVIKVSPAEVTELYPVVLGSSSNLTVGEPVAAIGNPWGLSDTITVGIVSSVEREMEAPGGYLIVDIIQADAAINPGNSGGPLVNLRGQVVGINTAIISGSDDFAGVGFAIPSDTIKREISDLIATGGYKHPWVGISGIDVTYAIAQRIGLDKPQGILVVDVVPGSPADGRLRGGAETVLIDGRLIRIGGDVIIGVDGLPVRKLSDLSLYTERNKRPGDNITLTIIRNGQSPSEVDLTLGERPPPA